MKSPLIVLLIFTCAKLCFSSAIALNHEKNFSVRNASFLLHEDSVSDYITNTSWEDQAYIEYDLSSITDDAANAKLHFTLSENIFPSQSSLVDVYVYSGNGDADISDWNSGTFLETVFMPNINIGDPSNVSFVVDTTNYLNQLLNSGATYIGFRFSMATPNRQCFLRSDVDTYLKITPKLSIPFDIRPNKKLNYLNVNKEFLWTLILGTKELKVEKIDVASIRLAGVAPIRSKFKDISTHIDCENEFGCSEAGPDGYRDLRLKFNVQEILDTIGNVNDGDEWILQLTGVLQNGTPFTGEDLIIIRSR